MEQGYFKVLLAMSMSLTTWLYIVLGDLRTFATSEKDYGKRPFAGVKGYMDTEVGEGVYLLPEV